MSAAATVMALRRLREQPLWLLLRADKAPEVIGMLQMLLLDTERELPGSVLLERVARELDQLRARGIEMSQTAQGYIAFWLIQGWLTRRLPPGASEEVYELTADTVNAIRFINSLLKPRTIATESRLAVVIAQLTRLAEETDPNPQSRVAALVAERDRIDREIAAVQAGAAQPLDSSRAVERAREIVALADELAADFRSVRDDFDKLNRRLRQSLLENEGSRGEVLGAMFEGIDVIGESDAGRTFNAFWRLLIDAEQSALLMDSLDAIAERSFVRQLESKERKFLLSLTATLMNEGSGVHDVLQHFARSLKSFVQSREFLEQRRLHALLRRAQQQALEVKEKVRANQNLEFELTLTSSQIRSVSQWLLYDPEVAVADATMRDSAAAELSLEVIGELVRQSEIDFRTLRAHVRAALVTASQVTVRELLERYPAEQGLGSVVGYLALGAKDGEIDEARTECVAWQGRDGASRRARIPTVYFLKDRVNELSE